MLTSTFWNFPIDKKLWTKSKIWVYKFTFSLSCSSFVRYFSNWISWSSFCKCWSWKHCLYCRYISNGGISNGSGAGPVGLACAASCLLLGAAVVIVGDLNKERLAQAKSFGCEIVDLTKVIQVLHLISQDETLIEQIDKILGEPFVDCAIDW